MDRTFLGLACTALIMLPQPALAQSKKIATIEVAPKGAANTIVCVPLSVPEEFAKLTDVTLIATDGKVSSGTSAQLTQPGLATEAIPASAKGMVRRDLYFHSSGEFIGRPVDVLAEPPLFLPDTFKWQKQPSEFAALTRGKRPVLRYMLKPYDNSNAAARDKTYKVFHHLYDFEGKRFVTNGGNTNEPVGDPKKLLYPHHRGLMYAFNNITYGKGIKADTWHAKPEDTHQSHRAFLVEEAGCVLGRHRVAVDWHGPKNEVFAKEEREITVFTNDKGTLVEFASRLKTAGGTVKLDGDPQHAGFQFRAHNDVAASSKNETYYLRPDGKGEKGEKGTRNWDPKTKKGPVNLPWDACSFVIDGKRYTVVYMNHPKNPGESRWSERDYARFGCYFAYELTEQSPLVVNYRIWLQEGEMTVDQCESLHKAFTAPPKVTVK
jgi:hypothetical protein